MGTIRKLNQQEGQYANRTQPADKDNRKARRATAARNRKTTTVNKTNPTPSKIGNTMSRIRFTNLPTSTSMQERQIRTDVPIPSSNRGSKWGFMHNMKHGESFLAHGSAERSAAATYGRNKGWKIVSRIEQELSMESQSMVYRVWKITQ